MKQGFRRHLSFANVTSMVALCVALGGTAYAAGLAPDSVGSRELKVGSVRSAEAKNGSLAGIDIQNNTLFGDDIHDGSLGGIDVGDGTLSGADVVDNSLTGTDIDEPTLVLPELTSGRSRSGKNCPAAGDFRTCKRLRLVARGRSRVFATASIGFRVNSGAADLTCRLRVGKETIGTSVTGATSSGSPAPGTVSVSGVSRVVRSGGSAVTLECRKVGVATDIRSVNLSALTIGPR